MATQRIDEGDYGVEVITIAKPAAEEKKVEPAAQAKPAAAKQEESKAKAAAADEDSYDEEAMYGEGTTFAGVKEENDGF